MSEPRLEGGKMADRRAPLAWKRVHLVGVAGTGMSALAQVLVDRGIQVSGSDRLYDRNEDVPLLNVLRAAGVELVPQDGRGVTQDLDAVVVSSAIEPDNPDLVAAQRCGCPLRHRVEVLCDLARGHRLLAVAGTCGKSTVTGMVGWILERTGHDPTVVNGAALIDWRRPDRVASVRAGRSEWMVVETDESDRSLLAFEPEYAVVTNVSVDHFSLEESCEVFRAFLGRVRNEAILGPEVARVLQLREGPWCVPVPEVGPCPSGGGVEFRWHGVQFWIPIPGVHNGWDALWAAALAERVGVRPEEAANALRTFRGLERRLEKVGTMGGAVVLDDYAHNPEKIRVAWTTAREFGRRILGVWRPHGYGPLARMLDELAEVWPTVARPEDRLLLLPVYYAGGTPGARVESDQLASRLAARGMEVELVADHARAELRLRELATPECVVLIMGARDPGLSRLARRLVVSS